jgi:hypothetical protein
VQNCGLILTGLEKNLSGDRRRQLEYNAQLVNINLINGLVMCRPHYYSLLQKFPAGFHCSAACTLKFKQRDKPSAFKGRLYCKNHYNTALLHGCTSSAAVSTRKRHLPASSSSPPPPARKYRKTSVGRQCELTGDKSLDCASSTQLSEPPILTAHTMYSPSAPLLVPQDSKILVGVHRGRNN